MKDWKAALARAEEFEKRFEQKMPKTDDLTLLVLKGHLLIEEVINSTIDALLPTPEALRPAQLDCYQRIRLLMAMVPDIGFHDTLEAFERLNTLRNKFGHMLEPPQVEDRIKTFIDTVEARMRRREKATATLPQRLEKAISFLCGELQAMGLFCIGLSKFTFLNVDHQEVPSAIAEAAK
ncbi:MAG TPA: hypothetical protein VHX61_14530 [Rhizomicrobium sp.]|jgi:hypothetical protein|nr:hypothetical protein [Rhizomicrobium sp.]